MPRTMLGRIMAGVSVTLLALFVGVSGYLYLNPQRGHAPAPADASYGQASIGGPFELVGTDGSAMTEEDFNGRYMLVFFGFTHCPDICPTSLLTLTNAIDQLEVEAPEKVEKIAPVFITVDPERDTPEIMGEYVSHFHERFVGLTGSEEQVREAARAFRVYYQKVEDEDAPDGYTVDHSGYIFLMSPEGEYLTHFTHYNSAEDIARSLSARVES